METKDRNGWLLNVHREDSRLWNEQPGDTSVSFRGDQQPVITPAIVLLGFLSTVRPL